MPDIEFELITIAEACQMIGGSKPISRATYYRGVEAERYPAPVHPSPGVARVRRDLLEDALRKLID